MWSSTSHSQGLNNSTSTSTSTTPNPPSNRQSLSSDSDVSSTSTAFSPTHSRQTSKTAKPFHNIGSGTGFGFSPTMSSFTDDSLEKGFGATESFDQNQIPPPISTSSSSPPTPSLAKLNLMHSPLALSPKRMPHIGLRRRRLLAQALMTFAVFTMGGWWMYGDSDMSLGQIWGTTKAPESNYGGSSFQPTLPGVVIGSGGSLFPSGTQGETVSEGDTETESVVGEKEPSFGDKMAELAHIQPQQWGLSLSSSKLLAGLSEWPVKPPMEEDYEPLSSLGRVADEVYSLGHSTLGEYADQMKEFALAVFPRKISDKLVLGLELFATTESTTDVAGSKSGAKWDVNKMVWQTDKDMRHAESDAVASWKKGQGSDEGWDWDLVTDAEADVWVKKRLGGSRFKEVWDNLPSGILRSDTLRYLLLLIEGGIYTDTDTVLLKAPSKWGQHSKLYKDGVGWLTDSQRTRLDSGETLDDVLGKASVVVGVEADVGEREDWNDWWPRPIQIVQWTLASTPFHPIALNALMRIYHATAQAVDWAHANAKSVKILKDQGRYEDARSVAAVSVLNEPKLGGPVGVMDWTGPGVWTDAVLSYLNVKYGLVWTDLRGIREPLRIGDVLILPVTGFSPGVGNFGSQPATHRQAMVEHLFAGSWKAESGTDTGTDATW